MQFNAIICNFNQEMIKLLSHVRVKQATSRFSLYISSQRVSNGLRETPNSGEEAIRSNCCFKSSALIVNGKYLHFIEGSQLIQSLYAIPYLKALGLPVHICTFLQSNRFLLVKWCRNLDISNRIFWGTDSLDISAIAQRLNFTPNNLLCNCRYI